MLRFLGIYGPAPPKHDPTDQVIPLHWFEDGYLWKRIIVYAMLVFDEALNAEKLHHALERLVARDGYRKLGGRLRKNSRGNVEYHVPAHFTPARPGVTFSHHHHDMNAADHEVACKIPRPSPNGQPAVVGNPEDLSELVRGPGGETLSLRDYLTSDRSTMGLRVTTFRDRTIITISWPHSAFDAMGLSAILTGWTLALQGRDAEISTPIGHDVDPLASFGRHATEPHLLAHRRLGPLGMAGYVARKVITLGGQQEIRMVCVPRPFWEGLVAEVRAGLAPGQFVTEGDVLVAWWTRLLCAHLAARPDVTVAAQSSMSLRRVLGGDDDLLPAGRPYISMAVTMPTVLLTAGDVLDRSLAWLALEFRRAIATQGTRAQVESYAALQRENVAAPGMPPLLGDVGMYSIFYSNWQRAALFDLDFSAAAACPEDGRAVRASYIQCVQDPAFPEGWPISGKDERGNYWISGFRAKGLWAVVEKELERQNQS